MKKQQKTEQGHPQVVYQKNKNRLIEQNRQLYSEIFRLENKVNTVLTQNMTYEFKQKVQEQKLSSRRQQLTQNQISEIKKLKKKILMIKNADKPQSKQDIRQALDQLVFLKKQKFKYDLEKDALIKNKHRKVQALQLNKPLQQERKHMLELYKAAQRQNFEIKNKSLKIQKEINSLHKIKQLAKTSAPKPNENYQFQVKKIEHEVKRLQKEIKQIEKQWHPRIDSLNTEYCLLKEIKDEKQQQINQLQRTLNTCKNRVLAMKQQNKILEDKARLLQVLISPEKRQQINQIYSTEKQKHHFFEQFKNRPRNKPVKLPLPKEPTMNKSRSKSPRNQTQRLLFQTEPIKLFESQIKADTNQQKETIIADNKNLSFNEFQPQKQKIYKPESNKPAKHFASVAVGTTFYYNEEEQNQDKV